MYLVIAEQVWYLPGRQEVVDEHQEPLVGHLGVGHEEHGSQVLQPRLLVEVGQVELQVGAGVSLAQGNLRREVQVVQNGVDANAMTKVSSIE